MSPALSSRTTVRQLLARGALLLAAASALSCALLVESAAALICSAQSAPVTGGAILSCLSCSPVESSERSS